MSLRYTEMHQLGEPADELSGFFYKGDMAEELPELLNDWHEKLQLVYLDPPFFTGKNFTFRQRVGEEGWRGNQKHLIVHQAYSDKWKSRDSFLKMLRNALTLSYQALKPEGSIFLHLDYRYSPYARLLMDEIFGENNFLNEIIWVYQSGGRAKRYFSRKHDTILFYRKSDKHYFNPEAVGKPRGKVQRNHMKRRVDEDGRTFWSIRSGGRIYRYYEDSKVYLSDVWDDISHLQQKDPERTGYDTQKPEALLERIILAASRQGDWIGDFFAGSGTTMAAAQKNGRKWIGMDSGDFSINVCRKRMLQCQGKGFFTLYDPSIKVQKYEENKNRVKLEIKQVCDLITGRAIDIRLLDYHSPVISELAGHFSDYIDYWAVGHLKNGKFISEQHSFRTPSCTKLQASLSLSVDAREEGTDAVALHLIDIYGEQLLLSLEDV